ncbi:MAG: site-specific DNA-methyltransferase [Muribaculaceae bacterium]|nr:site-specific DNA-methyltransferase [Muribaculaceae bacterium]
MQNLTIQNIKTADIRAYKNNPKLHTKAQVAKIRESIREFGFINPVLLDENMEIIAGHGRVAAAADAGMTDVPAIILSHLTDAQKRAYRIADNKLTELGKWSIELLNLEFSELCNLDLDFNLEITGFETADIDLFLNSNGASDPKVDSVPVLTDADRRCHRGDIWRLGRHTLICGDALAADTYAALMDDGRAQMVLTDPPYNVRVKNIGSMGKIKHDEFAMASGEMTPAEFTEFLATFMRHARDYSANGALHYLFMDWKHVGEITTAGASVYDDFKNICVWNKTNGGMGSLYRSKHEMCFIYKSGTAPHINNIELGAHGRYRTNVWDYAGANAFGAGKDDLKLHPTVKPVAMLRDAILDVTRRGDIVLDCFLGSGSTLIACELTGRICRGIELEEKYCDVTIKRFETLTGTKAEKIGEIK